MVTKSKNNPLPESNDQQSTKDISFAFWSNLSTRKEKTINIIDHYDALEGIKNINENEPYKYMGVYFSPNLDLNVNPSAFETLIVGYLRYYWFIDFSLKGVSALRKTIRDVMRQVGIVHISMSNDFLYLPRSLDKDYNSYQDRLKSKRKVTLILPIHRYDTVVYYASKLGIKKLEFNKDGKWKLIIKDNQIYTDNESIKDLSSIIRKFVNDKLYQKLKDEEVGIAKKRIWRENHKDWIHWINGWRHIPKMSLVHQDATYAGDRRCRLCSTAEESIEHLVSGCTTMYKSGVIPRHDSIVKEIVKALINRYQIPKVTNLIEPEIKYTETDSNVPIITGAFGSIISTNTTHTINNVTHPIGTLKECVHQLPLTNTKK
ncbi:hypothetical protein ACTFIY_004838 [Dictyostelium cf. discoideum]